MSYDIVSNNVSAFIVEGTQSRCASGHDLSIPGFTMSDIDAEDVVEAVAPSEANAAPARVVAVSLVFSEGYTPEKVEEVAFSNISGNGVTLNGIATRGKEGFLAISSRFLFQKRDATGHLGHSAEQNVAAALRVLVFAEAFDQPDHSLRMTEESISQSILRPTQHITEVYAQTEYTGK
jgi:hypothetical protein